MDALIFLAAGTPRAALFDIAGKPLVLRQVQWLRAIGCERIVIELPPGDLGTKVQWCLEQEPLGIGVSWVPFSGAPAREQAATQGLSERVVALPGDVLGDGDLTRILLAREASEIHASFRPPAALGGSVEGAVIRVFGPGSSTPECVEGPGWGVHVRDEDEAFRLSLAVLDGGLPQTSKTGWTVQIHARKIQSGVWVAQGGEVHETANLVRPVFIGPNAVVGRDAVVGPAVMLGEGGQVGSLAKLRASKVEARAAVPAASDIAAARIVPLFSRSPRAPSSSRARVWAIGAALAVLLAVATLAARGLP